MHRWFACGMCLTTAWLWPVRFALDAVPKLAKIKGVAAARLELAQTNFNAVWIILTSLREVFESHSEGSYHSNAPTYYHYQSIRPIKFQQTFKIGRGGYFDLKCQFCGAFDRPCILRMFSHWNSHKTWWITKLLPLELKNIFNFLKISKAMNITIC